MTTREDMTRRLHELDEQHDSALVEHAGKALHAALDERDPWHARHAFLVLQRVRNPTRYLRGIIWGARTWGALELRGNK